MRKIFTKNRPKIATFANNLKKFSEKICKNLRIKQDVKNIIKYSNLKIEF